MFIAATVASVAIVLIVPMLNVGVAAKAGSVPLIPKAVFVIDPIALLPVAKEGSEDKDTGCVACQNVPVTATEPVTPTLQLPDCVTPPMTFEPVANGGSDARLVANVPVPALAVTVPETGCVA